MLFRVRRGILLISVPSAWVDGLTGGLATGRLGISTLSPEIFCPEKMGSRISPDCEESTIFFLRLAALSESVKVQSEAAYSCLVCTACRTRC